MSAATRGTEISLGEKQEVFAKLLGQLLVWIHGHLSWRVRLAEGFVGYTDGQDGDHDGPHLTGGAHYNKLGQDFDLFILDERGLRFHVTTAHPAWDEIGTTWKGMHPLARWGGDFTSRDYNHFSLIHEGKS